MTFLCAVVVASFFAAPLPHDLHVAHARVAIEGPLLVSHVRFFRHDLEEALQRHHSLEVIDLSDPEADSLASRYLAHGFLVIADTDTLDGRLARSSGSDELWTYELEFVSPGPISSVTIAFRTLLELFPDQRNIARVSFFPERTAQSLYFVAGAEQHTLSRLQ